MIKNVLRMIAIFVPAILAGCAAQNAAVKSAAIEPDNYYPPGTPEIPLAPGPTQFASDYPVWFGTTRKPTANGNDYTDQRDNALHYGRVLVSIPKNHHIGSLGTRIGNLTGHDPELVVRNVYVVPDESQFINVVEDNLPPVMGPDNSYVLVFIHGYNNTFVDAAKRAAQLGSDLGVPPNNMFLFSWAARNHTLEYTVDEATIDTNEIYLRSFLNDVAHAAPGRKIHIIVHSMGNRALLRVVTSSVMGAASNNAVHFGQIILAAADVDKDLFAQLAPNYLQVADRITVYLSPYDYAVGASDFVHAYPRVGCGRTPQVTVPGIDNIVSTIPEDFPAHAYFAETLPVLTDIKNLMLRNMHARSGKEWRKIDDYWVVGGPVDEAKAVCY